MKALQASTSYGFFITPPCGSLSLRSTPQHCVTFALVDPSEKSVEIMRKFLIDLSVSSSMCTIKLFSNIVSHSPVDPSEKSVEIMRKFSEQYARKSGTYFCVDKGVTSVVIKGGVSLHAFPDA